jgi:hypothetical protein
MADAGQAEAKPQCLRYKDRGALPSSFIPSIQCGSGFAKRAAFQDNGQAQDLRDALRTFTALG